MDTEAPCFGEGGGNRPYVPHVLMPQGCLAIESSDELTTAHFA